MACFMIILSLLVLIPATSTRSNDCPGSQEVSCERLRSPEGNFIYTLPLRIPCPEDCEQGWYQNGTLIVYPKDSEERSPLVEDVTLESLTVKTCVNLQWQHLCGKCAMKNCTINYTVVDPKPPDENEDGNRDGSGKAEFPVWGIVIIGIVIGAIFIVLVLCFRNGNKCGDQGVV